MGKSKEIRVLLFRTGETEWERAGRIGGAADVPLSLSGFEAVRKTVEGLNGTRVATVYCGPDEASQATARELAQHGGTKVKVVDELGEIHLGLWEGLLKSELEGKCPRTYRQWVENPGVVRAPEGESLDEAQSRIMSALSRSLKGAKTDNGAIAFVLRPVAMALVGCAVGEKAAEGGTAVCGGGEKRNVWSMLETGPMTQWHTLPRTFGSEARQGAGTAGA
jgi:broad specificity phosphatase PhoE